jgi:hypothetical protein
VHKDNAFFGFSRELGRFYCELLSPANDGTDVTWGTQRPEQRGACIHNGKKLVIVRRFDPSQPLEYVIIILLQIESRFAREIKQNYMKIPPCLIFV